MESLRPPAGEVGARHAEGATYVAAQPTWAPPFEHSRARLAGRGAGPFAAAAHTANTYAWAWIDEAAGTIRARSFVPEVGIAEDEATGSAALALCARLARPLTIHQGHGSVLLCRPLADGRVEVWRPRRPGRSARASSRRLSSVESGGNFGTKFSAFSDQASSSSSASDDYRRTFSLHFGALRGDWMAARVARLYMSAGRQLQGLLVESLEAKQERCCSTRPARETMRLLRLNK